MGEIDRLVRVLKTAELERDSLKKRVDEIGQETESQLLAATKQIERLQVRSQEIEDENISKDDQLNKFRAQLEDLRTQLRDQVGAMERVRGEADAAKQANVVAERN